MTPPARRPRRRKGPILPTLLAELKKARRGPPAKVGDDLALHALIANAYDGLHDGLRAALMRATAQGYRLHYAVVHRPTGLVLFGPHGSLQGVQIWINKRTDFSAGVLYVPVRHLRAAAPARPVVTAAVVHGRHWGACYAFPRAELVVESARVAYAPAWAGRVEGLTAPQLPSAPAAARWPVQRSPEAP